MDYISSSASKGVLEKEVDNGCPMTWCLEYSVGLSVRKTKFKPPLGDGGESTKPHSFPGDCHSHSAMEGKGTSMQSLSTLGAKLGSHVICFWASQATMCSQEVYICALTTTVNAQSAQLVTYSCSCVQVSMSKNRMPNCVSAIFDTEKTKKCHIDHQVCTLR